MAKHSISSQKLDRFDLHESLARAVSWLHRNSARTRPDYRSNRDYIDADGVPHRYEFPLVRFLAGAHFSRFKILGRLSVNDARNDNTASYAVAWK